MARSRRLPVLVTETLWRQPSGELAEIEECLDLLERQGLIETRGRQPPDARFEVRFPEASP